MFDKKRKLLFTYSWTLLIVVLLVFLSRFFYGETLKLHQRGVAYLDSGWTFETDGRTEAVEASLPTHYHLPENTQYAVKKVLPEAFDAEQTLCFRGSLQRVSVWLDGVELYSRQFESIRGLSMPVASAWHVMTLPLKSAGKTIEIRLSSPYEDMSGYLNPVFYGGQGDVMLEVIETHGWDFVTSFIILVIGAVMVIFPMLFRLPNRKQFLYLGLFAISISLWLIAESRLIQFFVGSAFYIGSSAYIMLTLFPIPILLFVREFVLIGYKKYYTFAVRLFAFEAVAILLMQLFSIMDFYESVRITHFTIFLTILMLAYTMLYEIKNKRNEEALYFFKALLALLIFGIFELIHFYFIGVIAVSLWVRLGFLSFVVTLGVHTVQRLLDALRASFETEYYQKLAYEDRVTGGPNRTAFEEAFEAFFKAPEKLKTLRLVIFDLNKLKIINDQYGHVEGDRAIRLAYTCISETFGLVGTCYRIGGDEYACLIEGSQCDDALFNKLEVLFHKKIDQACHSVAYPFGVAFGDVVYDARYDTTVKAMMYRADQKMYEDKIRRQIGGSYAQRKSEAGA